MGSVFQARLCEKKPRYICGFTCLDTIDTHSISLRRCASIQVDGGSSPIELDRCSSKGCSVRTGLQMEGFRKEMSNITRRRCPGALLDQNSGVSKSNPNYLCMSHSKRYLWDHLEMGDIGKEAKCPKS